MRAEAIGPTGWRPPAVEIAYTALLETIRDNRVIIGDVELTSHWPLIGTADRRILVVGQAVFGWIPSWRPPELATPEGMAGVLRETQASCYERADPMDWIVENRARISPFWRTVRLVCQGLFPASSHPWYSHIAWANLYPVARNDVRGNPEGVLRSVQTELGARLADVIADELDPEAVLVLAGSFWWSFAGSLRLEAQSEAARPLLAVGRRHGRPWTVGMHPGGAQRRGWGASAYADQIIAALSEAIGLNTS